MKFHILPQADVRSFKQISTDSTVSASKAMSGQPFDPTTTDCYKSLISIILYK